MHICLVWDYPNSKLKGKQYRCNIYKIVIEIFPDPDWFVGFVTQFFREWQINVTSGLKQEIWVDLPEY